MKTDRRGNVKFIVTSYKDRLTSWITTTYPYIFSFGLSSVISKVFVVDFEQVFVSWKRYRTKPIVVLILKYLAQQTSTYSKSAVETLKEDVKSAKIQQHRLRFLLTTCNMAKTCSCFLVYYKHGFVYCFAFVFTIFFFRCLYCQF